jgi:hypothetical protein
MPPAAEPFATDEKPNTPQSSDSVEDNKPFVSPPPSVVSRGIWIAGGVAGLVLIGGLATFVFGQRDTQALPEQAKAKTIETNTAPKEPLNLPAPAPAPVAEPVKDEKEERIKQLEQQLALVEAEKHKSKLAAQNSKPQEAAAPAVAPVSSAPVVPQGVAPAPAGRESFRAESRGQNETCNTHSDCQGQLKCVSGLCFPQGGNAPAKPVQDSPQKAPTKSQPGIPGNVTHLDGTVFLFKNSQKDLGNGFKGVMAVSNSDVASGEPGAGHVKSQVTRWVLNCTNATWGYDQLYYFAMPFGEGNRIAAKEWQPNQVAFSPVDNAQSWVKKAYGTVCR